VDWHLAWDGYVVKLVFVFFWSPEAIGRSMINDG
jgi:hypothetical protein